MANEIHFSWITGESLTFGVYQEDGTQREVGTAMSETPASSGNYIGSPTTIAEADTVVISDGSGVIGGGQYWLDSIASKIDTVDANVDTILSKVRTTTYVYDETTTEQKPSIEL